MTLHSGDFAFNQLEPPRRKHDPAPGSDADVGIRAAVLLVIGSAIAFLKNVLPTSSVREHASESGVIDRIAATHQSMGDEALGVTASSTPDNTDAPLSSSPSGSAVHFIKVLPSSGSLSTLAPFRISHHGPAPMNDNDPIAPPRPGSGPLADFGAGQVARTPSGADGGEAGDDRAKADEPTARDGDPTEEPDSQSKSNRAPLVAGQLALGLLAMNQVKQLTHAQLLANVTDPDGDAVDVKWITPSDGSVLEVGYGRWLYTPDYNDAGIVTFSYGVSDGLVVTVATAALRIEGPTTDIDATTAHLVGTELSDDIIATARDDVIEALEGDDTIIGREGADTIFAGAGHDRVIAGEGDDVVFGGTGGDFISGDGGDDVLFGEEGSDVVLGGSDDDYIDGGADADKLFGDAGEDTIVGGAGEDQLEGGTGNDIFIAQLNDGNDHVVGGDGVDCADYSASEADIIVDLSNGIAAGDDIGVDRLVGLENVVTGSGNDTIVANHERNELAGGAGEDTFVFLSVQHVGLAANRDKIRDFELGDRIKLDDIAKGLESIVDQELGQIDGVRFHLIDGSAVFSKPGQMKFAHFKSDDTGRDYTILSGNTDLDDAAEFELEIEGRYTLTDNDFSTSL